MAGVDYTFRLGIDCHCIGCCRPASMDWLKENDGRHVRKLKEGNRTTHEIELPVDSEKTCPCGGRRFVIRLMSG